MPTLTEILLRKSVLRAIQVERFKNNLVNRTVGNMNSGALKNMMGRLAEDVRGMGWRGVRGTTTKKFLSAMDRFDGAAKQMVVDVRRNMTSQLNELARNQVRFTMRDLPKGFKQPNLSGILSKDPFQGQTLNKHFSDMSQRLRRDVRAEVTKGIRQGEKASDIAKRIRGTKAQGFRNGALNAARKDAELLARTGASHARSQATEAIAVANRDKVQAIIYEAVLDNRTTHICKGLSSDDLFGLGAGVFPIGEGERPPQHLQCRSYTSLWLKQDELPERQTYEQWLREQPRATQRDILGPGRLEHFDSGLSVGGFTDSAGRTLTLRQLEAA